MKRNIDKKLSEWGKNPNKKPLIVRGARQVGKTYSISDFGTHYFETFIRLDFERDRSIHKVFDDDLSTKRLVMHFETLTEKRIIPGKTLLFFDEIQECERALLSLRYFYEEMPELHLIAVGSMLEFALGDVSFPVGRVSFEMMYPMVFHEFLLATGQEILAGTLPSFSEIKSVSPVIHAKIIDQLKIYLLTGGLPQAVDRYRSSGSLEESFGVHKDVYVSYLQSLVKYNRRANVDSLDHVLSSIPSHVGRQIKYAHLDPDRRIEMTKASLRILERALILFIVKSSNAQGLPLNAAASGKIMKPLFLDVGLMQHACGINAASVLRENDLLNIYKGAVAEQFVGQEMLASGGSENDNMFYWARANKSSSAEIDYLYALNGEILPIEVKSGPAGKLKSLHMFLKEHPQVKMGYVMSPAVFEEQIVDQLSFIPIYTRFD